MQGFHRSGFTMTKPPARPKRGSTTSSERAGRWNGNFLHVELPAGLVRLGLGRQDGVRPAFDAQCPPVDEPHRPRLAGPASVRPKGVARNAHPFGAFSGSEPSKSCKAQGFQAFNRSPAFREFGHGIQRGLK